MNNEKNLWGGRFTGQPDEKFARFNRSFGFDQRLFVADVRGSIAHCEGLRQAGVLAHGDAMLIQNALQKLLEKSTQEEASFFADSKSEDVHSFIESKLIEIVGDVGRKLHTGRSRNDQVATALRIWQREAIYRILHNLRNMQKSLVALAETNEKAVLPGYTHLQRAQPVLFAHWCLAYFEMLQRDAQRLQEIRKRTNVLPLGSAALAGTSYPIAREMVARFLEFEGVTRNSLDAVSDRDFAVEFVFAASLIMTHLSRLAEDVILYATAEFGFFELSDAVATGSSLMPQKKNPDSMELVRGKSGRVFGHLTALLTILKGLPLAYNKDLQEDKEAVFDAFDTTYDCLQIAAIVLKNLRVNEQKSREAAMQGYLNATELADYLAKKGVPFRAAHETVGKIVLRAIELEVELNEMDLDEMKTFSNQIETDVFQVLSLKSTLASKNTIGGTAPSRVSEEIKRAKAILEG
ncbi:MAG: argininosuccinate lyase [Pyrinomonadaceae bacterium]